MGCTPDRTRRAITWTAAFACWASSSIVEVNAADPSVNEAIRSVLPRYDPKVRDSHLAAEASKSAPTSAPASVTEATVAPPNLVTLPRITVRPTTTDSAPPVALPRIVVRPPTNDVKEEAFLTPAAKDAQLVKKHLSTFDRSFLNRFKIPFVGQTNVARAREAERIEQSARQLDVIADLLQSKTAQPRDPEEDKRLKELYLDTFVSRPK